jgi:selenide,water dikinase
VDDAYAWGAIAAANALSDVYAMGGTPVIALNILCWPAKDEFLGPTVLERLLAGGADKCAEAGIGIAGGHSVEDAEPKYGLAVTGVIHPDEIWRNVGAEPGDALVLTKPLGSGIVATGHKRNVATAEEVRIAVQVMSQLNDVASAGIKAVGGANAVTDVTGFGLLGHLREMMAPGQARAHIRFNAVPVQAAAQRLASEGVFPGGTRANLEAARGDIRFAASLQEPQQLILADAQTSGGLLVSLPAARADELLDELESEGARGAAIIGEVLERNGDEPAIEVSA